jgi:undecaprenyl-diphosphatase
VQHIVGRASVLLLGLLITGLLIAWIARLIANNPDRLKAWWSHQLERPVLRWFRAPLEFLGRRFRPGEALGLGLTLGLVTVGVIGVLFGVVFRDVAQHQELVHFDRPLLDFLIRHTEGGVTQAMKVITVFGSTPFVFVVAGLLAIVFVARGTWPRAFLIVVAPAGAWILQRVVKAIVHRPRPPVHALVHQTGSAFPSAHATIATALYAIIALLLARVTPSWRLKVLIWTVAFMFVGLVGFSRLYLRVHWLTDVLGGFALGATWTTVVASGLGVWQRARVRSRV